MKVILDAQIALQNIIYSGIPLSVLCLTDTLVRRKKNEYEITYMPCETDTRINEHFGKYGIPLKPMCDNYYNFQLLQDALLDKSYNEVTNTQGDIYMFMFQYAIHPVNITGRMINIVYDLTPVLINDDFSATFKKAFSHSLKVIEKTNTTVITCSESTKQDLLKFTNIKENRIHVVRWGTHVNCATKDFESGKVLDSLNIRGDFLFSVGSNSNLRKNQLRMIQAFESVANRYKDLSFIIIGREDSELFAHIQNSQYKDRIKILGYVSEKEKAALYSGAAALMYCSLYEGFGMPITEAFAYGCPVITSNVSSMPEVAGDAAVLVDPYSTESIADGIDRVMGSETLRRELIAKGKERVKLLTWDKCAEQTEKVFEHVYENEEPWDGKKFIKTVNFDNKVLNKKIAIAGLGRIYESTFHNQNHILNRYKTVALADTNKAGQTVDGHVVVSFDKLGSYDFDMVVVTVLQPDEIVEQLKNAGIPEEKIMLLPDLKDIIFDKIYKCFDV